MGVVWGGDEEMVVDCYYYIFEDVVEGIYFYNLEVFLEDYFLEVLQEVYQLLGGYFVVFLEERMKYILKGEMYIKRDIIW